MLELYKAKGYPDDRRGERERAIEPEARARGSSGRRTNDDNASAPECPHDDDILNLIIEVTGQRDKEKEAKVSTAKTLWVPAVNNAGTWGRWAFIEIGDPWDAQNTIRAFLTNVGDSHERQTRS